MSLKYLVLLSFLANATFLFGQTDRHHKEKSVLNTCVSFANESIHGMLIAHRLFENYNQDINKYVDLPGHQLNFYNNTDLPQDIFDDPDHWFYETSPSSLFKECNKIGNVLQESDRQAILSTLANIQATTFRNNSLRLSIGEAINQRDLSIQDTLYGIYSMLEDAVDAFDVFSAQLLILENQLEKAFSASITAKQSSKHPALTKRLKNIHTFSLDMLRAIKNNDPSEVEVNLGKLKNEFKGFESYSLQNDGGFISSSYVRNRKRLINNIELMIEGSSMYLENTEIPLEYALYGKEYYHYNTQLLNKVNRYGNGMVQAINQLIDLLNLPLLHRLEIPHYLVIIYPEKAEKKLPVIQSSVKEIVAVPETLENRKVVMSDQKHVIHVDNAEPTLEIFDHLKQDGDIISLYYNGEWIFQNLSLERNPKKFILKLNPSGKNFLILHAVNEGNIPPNTIGINYTDMGRRKRYIMQSNLQTSQMVEIIIND